MRFQILIFNGFDELDAVAPFEVLRNAERANTDAVVELVTVGAATEIVAAHGLRLHPSAQLDLNRRPDVLIVPGGGWAARSAMGAHAEAARGVIPTMLKSLHESGTLCLPPFAPEPCCWPQRKSCGDGRLSRIIAR